MSLCSIDLTVNIDNLLSILSQLDKVTVIAKVLIYYLYYQ